jgi:Fic family protein
VQCGRRFRACAREPATLVRSIKADMASLDLSEDTAPPARARLVRVGQHNGRRQLAREFVASQTSAFGPRDMERALGISNGTANAEIQRLRQRGEIVRVGQALYAKSAQAAE